MIEITAMKNLLDKSKKISTIMMKWKRLGPLVDQEYKGNKHLISRLARVENILVPQILTKNRWITC